MATETDLSKYPTTDAELLAIGQLGAYEADTEPIFGFGKQTMRRWRRLGTGPRYSKKNGRIHYLFADVIAWLRSSSYASRAEEVAINGIGGGE